MATRRYKLSRGETEFDIVEEAGGATDSDDFEFTVDLADAPSREQVLLALRMIENWIVSHNWPPA